MFDKVILNEAETSVDNDADLKKTVENAASKNILSKSAIKLKLSVFLQMTSSVFMRLLKSSAN